MIGLDLDSSDAESYYRFNLSRYSCLIYPGTGIIYPGIGLLYPYVDLENSCIGLVYPGIGLINPDIG